MAAKNWQNGSKSELNLSLHPGGHKGGGPAGYLKGPKERAKSTRRTLTRLWTYVRAQGIKLILALLSICCATLLQITGPYLMGIAIDDYLIAGVDLTGLGRIVLLMAGVYLLQSGFVLLQQWVMIGVGQGAVKRLREQLFARYQELTIRFFDTWPHGELMSRLTNDIENISDVLSSSLVQFISSILSLTGVTVMMFIINWQLALVCLCLIPLIIVLTRTIAKHTRRGYVDQQKSLGDLNSLIEETITGQRVVKAFCREQAVLGEFREINLRLKKAALKANIFAGFLGPVMNMVNNLNFAVSAFAGGVFAVMGRATVGTIAVFLNYTRQFSRPLNHIAQLYNSIQSALAGAERVFEILDTEPDLRDSPGAVPVGTFTGEVEFQNITFGYKPDQQVLRGISFKAEAGQTIALVGPTGAGKTTIVNLLTRFYEIWEGAILIDGIDIRNIRLADLRGNLGIVLQDTVLFSASVRENIRYGRLSALDTEIETAARMANAHYFIRHLPEGYNTYITEGGVNLSQGQKQLLAIARCILSDPAVLILDEATSSVDTRTEVHIQQAMLKLMEGRTSFVIAHRLNTIRYADWILVIDGGRIVEQGIHEVLMAERGFYHNLYSRQFGVGE